MFDHVRKLHEIRISVSVGKVYQISAAPVSLEAFLAASGLRQQG